MSKPAPAMDGSAPAPRIIAVLNQKGGVGKTTSTVNLGAALAEAGLRVCMIDLDPQAHLTLHFGIAPEQIQRTVYDLLIDPECYVTDAIISARPNIDVIVAEVDLAAAETELAQADGRQTILRSKMESIAKAYDVVLIDCPPSLGILTLNALSFATEIFVPMQAHFLALQGVGRLLETVGLVCQSINPELRVTGIILCMHEAQTTLAREIVSDLDAFFEAARGQSVPWSGCRVLKPPIRRNVKLAEAPSFGKTIFDYEPVCPGAADYRLLAADLLRSWGRTPPPVEAPASIQKQAAASVNAPSPEAAPASPKVESKPTPKRAAAHVETEPMQVEPKVVSKPRSRPTEAAPEVVTAPTKVKQAPVRAASAPIVMPVSAPASSSPQPSETASAAPVTRSQPRVAGKSPA